MRRSVSVLASPGRLRANVPLSLVVVPTVVFVTTTDTAGTGVPSTASVTFPVIRPSC